MTALDIPVILFQIILPLGLLGWLILKPNKSIFGFLLQAIASGLGLLAIALTSIWIIPPWWIPIFYGAVWLAAVMFHIVNGSHLYSTWFPCGAISWLISMGFSILGIYGGLLSIDALIGRYIPDTQTIDLPLPMGPGTYLVANGGATGSINAHLLTLYPKTERQRAYRGQSFAVDLVKVGPLGNRANGWRPRDPTAYRIFGERVFAPCDGVVDVAADDMPDMLVPNPDRTRLEGNHVFINCGNFGVLLAHLQSDSLLVKNGDRIYTGQPIAKVGNSGQSYEPHLHIHVQELVKDGFILSGEPFNLTLNGIYPVRNMRLNGLME